MGIKFKGLLLITIQALIIGASLWVLELGSEIYLRKNGSPYEKSLFLLKPDSRLGWVSRQNLNEEFLGSNIRTNALGFRTSFAIEAESITIAVLGPSSAFGWGVDRGRRYSDILEKTLRQNGIKARVDNYSVIGHSSYQGLLLAETLERISNADFVIVGYGINDLDRNRFFFQSNQTDAEVFAKGIPYFQLQLESFFVQSSLLRVLHKKMYNISKMIFCPSFSLNKKKRVSGEETLKNLDGIYNAIKLNNPKRFIVLSTPYSIAAPTPLQNWSEKSIYQNAVRLFDAGDSKSAEEKFMTISNSEYYSCEANYYLAQISADSGKCRRAYRLLHRARNQEPKRIAKEVYKLNNILKEFASVNNYGFIDLSIQLKSEKFFLDPVHPSDSGHRHIADSLSYAILGELDE